MRFSGDRVTVGCAVYLSAAMGVIAIYVTSIARLPAAYGITLTELGTLGILMPLSCTAGSLALTRVKAALGLRGCLYLGGGLVCLQAVLLRLAGAQRWVLALILIAGGLVASLSAQTVMAEIIGRWYIRGRASRTALVLGASPFGSAVFQAVSGRILERSGYVSGAFRLYLFTGLLMLLCARALISVSPEEAGQRPLGADDPTEEVPLPTGERPAAGMVLYKSRPFWFLVAATILSAGNTTYIQSYFTTVLTAGGWTLSGASALLGVLSVSGGLFLMAGGRILDRWKLRSFLGLLILSAVGANIGMCLFAAGGGAAALLPAAALYGPGSVVPNIGNLIAGKLFGQENVSDAASKCYAAYSGTNILLQPLCAYVAQRAGFPVLYSLVAAMCGVSLVFYSAAVRGHDGCAR